MDHIIVAALYQFKALSHLEDIKALLEKVCKANTIKGTLLLAKEGINGTVAGTREAIDALKLKLVLLFDNLEYKESKATKMPFHRLKIKVKPEIVTLNQHHINPAEKVGMYVNPQEWNQLITDPEVVVIDTRNHYEVGIGHFKGALNPQTETFQEFPAYVASLNPQKHRKIAMYCTGGIRCEKASAYMLSQGFKDVYHLKGGILKYLEQIPAEESLWEGECFVFDGRVAVSHGLKAGGYAACFGCRRPISQDDIASHYYERGVSCPHCYTKQADSQKAAARQRQLQEDLALKRGEKHVGGEMPNKRAHPAFHSQEQ